MGNLFFFKSYDHDLGDMGKRRWHEVRKLLPLAFEYVNDAMTLDWEDGARRSVVVGPRGAEPSVSRANDAQVSLPPAGPFDPRTMLIDRADATDEVFVQDATAWLRFFAWCDFLEHRDGVFRLYGGCVTALRVATTGIEDHAAPFD